MRSYGPMFKRYDIIIAIIIIVIAISAVIIAFSEKGNTVEISLNGKTIYSIPLDTDRTIIIENVGTIIIEDGSVSMTQATCPDKLCEMHGSISRVGQSIICLPNRLIITVKGRGEWDVIV